jgi:3-phenylpropionate/cinnamic acid dioxygenase small subunit
MTETNKKRKRESPSYGIYLKYTVEDIKEFAQDEANIHAFRSYVLNISDHLSESDLDTYLLHYMAMISYEMFKHNDDNVILRYFKKDLVWLLEDETDPLEKWLVMKKIGPGIVSPITQMDLSCVKIQEPSDQINEPK